jgi:Flp pilus assembly protein TadG
MRTLMRRKLAAFARDQKGAMTIEVLCSVPLVVAILLGGIEFGRYVLIHQKLERTSATIADLVAQADNMSEARMDGILSATEHVMDPFDIGTAGNVIVSSVTGGAGGVTTINWQRGLDGHSAESRIGTEGGSATLPLTVVEGENLIVCEAIFDYEPLALDAVFEAGELYRQSLFLPRYGALDTIAP